MEIFAVETITLLLVAFLLGCVAGHLLQGALGRRLAPSTEGDALSREAPAKPVTQRVRRRRNRDELTRIKGIGPTIEKKLNRMGIKRFEQIAGWDLADVAVIDQRLAFKGRIERENWVKQARKLADAKS